MINSNSSNSPSLDSYIQKNADLNLLATVTRDDADLVSKTTWWRGARTRKNSRGEHFPKLNQFLSKNAETVKATFEEFLNNPGLEVATCYWDLSERIIRFEKALDPGDQTDENKAVIKNMSAIRKILSSKIKLLEPPITPPDFSSRTSTQSPRRSDEESELSGSSSTESLSLSDNPDQVVNVQPPPPPPMSVGGPPPPPPPPPPPAKETASQQIAKIAVAFEKLLQTPSSRAASSSSSSAAVVSPIIHDESEFKKILTSVNKIKTTTPEEGKAKDSLIRHCRNAVISIKDQKIEDQNSLVNYMEVKLSKKRAKTKDWITKTREFERIQKNPDYKTFLKEQKVIEGLKNKLEADIEKLDNATQSLEILKNGVPYSHEGQPHIKIGNYLIPIEEYHKQLPECEQLIGELRVDIARYRSEIPQLEGKLAESYSPDHIFYKLEEQLRMSKAKGDQSSHAAHNLDQKLKTEQQKLEKLKQDRLNFIEGKAEVEAPPVVLEAPKVDLSEISGKKLKTTLRVLKTGTSMLDVAAMHTKKPESS